jgi:hypothetical protein
MMTPNLERVTKPIVPLLTALAALLASCTALWKAVDKTVERKGYETTTEAIEELRRENDALRRSLDAIGFESVSEAVDIAEKSLLLPAAGSSSASTSTSASVSAPWAAVPSAYAATVHVSPTLWVPAASAKPGAFSGAAAPRPPMPTWTALSE